MSVTPEDERTADLVGAVERGDRAALDALLPIVYRELTILARRQRRSWQGDLSLNTTALVHEAYLKLAGNGRLTANGRGHFFAVAAKAMRHVLCNHARARRRQKRGGGVSTLHLGPGEELAVAIDLSDERSEELAALDEALDALQRVAERQARVVECRFFGGLSVEETAEALALSPRTVKRDWSYARAWLRREMRATLGEPGEADEPGTRG